MSIMEKLRKTFKIGFVRNGSEKDQGELVPWLILVAGIAVIATAVVWVIGSAISGQGANVADCIAGANNNPGTVYDNCTKDTHNVKNNVDNIINNQQKQGRF